MLSDRELRTLERFGRNKVEDPWDAEDHRIGAMLLTLIEEVRAGRVPPVDDPASSEHSQATPDSGVSS